jgi:hypothetical protein
LDCELELLKGAAFDHVRLQAGGALPLMSGVASTASAHY